MDYIKIFAEFEETNAPYIQRYKFIQKHMFTIDETQRDGFFYMALNSIRNVGSLEGMKHERSRIMKLVSPLTSE